MEIVIPYGVLDHALRELARRTGHVFFGRLYPGAAPHQMLVPNLSADGERQGIAVRLESTTRSAAAADAAVELQVEADGAWRAESRSNNRDRGARPQRVESLFLPGPNMFRLAPDGTQMRRQELEGNIRLSWLSGLGKALQSQSREPDAAFSRTAHALGGWEVQQRFQGLTYAVVGAGRNASAIVEHLARQGVASVVIIDPDRLEPSNLDAMSLVRPSDLTMFPAQGKARLLAAHVAELSPGTMVRAIERWAHHADACAALATADVIISAPDHDAARFIAAAMAAMYLKPHLDIGSAALRGQDGRRELGIDIRLTLPGQSRCLVCFGGLARVSDLDVLLGDGQVLEQGHWTARRLGSLRSLSSIAGGMAMRALEDLVSGYINQCLWWRLTQAEGGVPQVISGNARQDPACPVCAASGEGDLALPRINKILAAVGRRAADQR